MRQKKVEFQKRHFEFLAEALGTAMRYAEITPFTAQDLTSEFARALGTTNGLFRPETFEIAVGEAYKNG